MILNLGCLTRKQIILLNEISEEIVSDYHKLIEDIYSKTDRSVDWLVDTILSRNPYQSDLFIDICYIEFIKAQLKSISEIETIIVNKKSLKKTLKQYLKNQNYNTIVVLEDEKKRRHNTIFNQISQLILNIYDSLQYLILSSKKRRKNTLTNKSLTLLDTFFLQSMFNDDQFTDRYYQGIYDYCHDSDTVFFTPTILIRKNLKRIIEIANNSECNFLYKFDFLKASDYFFAITRPFRIKRINFNQFHFRDINVRYLLQNEFRTFINNGSQFLGILNYRFFKRLRGADVKLKLVINWFENQPIDKGFNKGVSEFYPTTNSIGYQGLIASFSYNKHLIPTEIECRNGSIPKEIGVIGKGLIDVFKSANSKLKVSVYPAFRFQGVWNIAKEETILINKNVLVALPITITESYEILKIIDDTIFSKSLHNIHFHIKAHPALNLIALEKKFPTGFPNSFSIVTGNFNDCLLNTSLLIGNASSTCLETLAIGIPVIIIGSQSGLTQNPIPETIKSDIWTLCYTPEELVEAINFYMNQTPEKRKEYIEIGEKIREEYFEPVTCKGVRKFLELDNQNI